MTKSRFTFDWDEHPEMTEDLKRRWELGQSAKVIADAFGHGLSRCAIIGKARRLGLKTPARKSKKQTYQPKPPKPPKMTVEIPHDCPIPLTPPETFADKGCKFISGDPLKPDWVMCGHEVKGKSQWCLYHWDKVHDLAAMAAAARRSHGR